MFTVSKGVAHAAQIRRRGIALVTSVDPGLRRADYVVCFILKLLIIVIICMLPNSPSGSQMVVKKASFNQAFASPKNIILK